MYHLRTQRLGLKDRVQFPEEAALGMTRKVKSLVMERLRGNVEVGVQGRWQEVSIVSCKKKKKGKILTGRQL